MVQRWMGRLLGGPPKLTKVDRHVIATMTAIGASTDEIAATFGYEQHQLAAVLPADRPLVRPRDARV